MPNNQAGVGARGRGRPKGSPNRITKAIRDVLSTVLEDAESEKRLRELRDADNPIDRATFWRLASKLIPAELHAKVESHVRLQVVDLSDQRKDPDGLAEG